MVGTFDWQAKAFYDKHGYMLNDTMTDVPKGHEHYMLTKRLDRPSAEYMPLDCQQYEIKRGNEKDAEILSSKLREYDSTVAPHEHEYISLSKKIVDENGCIIAGFVGGIDGWNGTDIDALWVEEKYRNQGIGSQLLAASFLAWLDEAYGFEQLSLFCFGQKTFDEAFGMKFNIAYKNWRTWITETYPAD